MKTVTCHHLWNGYCLCAAIGGIVWAGLRTGQPGGLNLGIWKDQMGAARYGG